MKRELIKTIRIDKANLEHIAKTGNINGTLLIEIERVMTEYAQKQANGDEQGESNCNIPLVMPRISYAEDWEGNKYEPCEVNCKLDDEGKISFETKEVFGLGDVPLDLEPVYGA